MQSYVFTVVHTIIVLVEMYDCMEFDDFVCVFESMESMNIELSIED